MHHTDRLGELCGGGRLIDVAFGAPCDCFQDRFVVGAHRVGYAIHDRT
jgi:hypothetical protein